MTSLNIDELQNVPRLKALIGAGAVIEIREGEEPIAHILPIAMFSTAEPFVPPAGKWADFGARSRAIFGDRILPGADLLIEERESSRY